MLERESLALLTRLVNRVSTCENTVFDTRPTHRAFFYELTPPAHTYYAGSYRGSHACLVDYEVGTTDGDPNVGRHSTLVVSAMAFFSTTIQASMAAIDAGWALPTAIMPEHEKLKFVIALAARAFVEFLSIHPYADGNGHIARVVVRTMLARFGYYPDDFTIEPRPNEPYLSLIRSYRMGDPVPLEAHILQQLM